MKHNSIFTGILFSTIALPSAATNSIEQELVTVFTPIRMEQHRKNAPAAVTIITSQKIKSLGISTFPEIFRLVPGFRVNQASGWDYRIAYHGTNAMIPRRTLVLIDGMSAFRYGFAQVDWNRLAIDVENIERIEITRSPSAVSYGSNAFNVVINVITKHPDDVSTTELLAESGSLNSKRYFGRASTSFKNTSISASISKQSDDGFDLVEFDNGKEPVPGAVDNQSLERFSLKTYSVFSENTLELNIGGIRADLEEEEVDSNQLAPPFKEQEDWHAQVLYKHIFDDKHFAKVKAYTRKSNYNENWRACHPSVLYLSSLRNLSQENKGMALNLVSGNIPTPSTDTEASLLQATMMDLASLGSSALDPLCGKGNHDIEEVSNVFEIEDTIQPFENTRINTTLGYKDNSAESETYFGGTENSNHLYLFSNAEIELHSKLIANAGVIYEKVSNVDDHSFNPRLGFNYHYSDHNTIRLVYSSASRLPNILETDRNWNYYVREWDREFDGRNEGYFFLTTSSDQELKPEKIHAYELGLFGSKNHYTYDIRLFREFLDHLISEKATFFDFNLTNNSESTINGIEAEGTIKINSNIDLSMTYSYLDLEYSNFYEQTIHSYHAGSFSGTYYSNIGTVSLAYYSNSDLAGESFDRLDAIYLKNFSFNNHDFDFRFVYSRLGNSDHAYQIHENRRVKHSYNDSNFFKAEISYSY